MLVDGFQGCPKDTRCRHMGVYEIKITLGRHHSIMTTMKTLNNHLGITLVYDCAVEFNQTRKQQRAKPENLAIADSGEQSLHLRAPLQETNPGHAKEEKHVQLLYGRVSTIYAMMLMSDV